MKVVSPAGEFEFKVKKSAVEGEHIVMIGQMGVWDSKIYLTPGDIWRFTSMFLTPSVILFILKLPFKSLLGSKQPEAAQDEKNSEDNNSTKDKDTK